MRRNNLKFGDKFGHLTVLKFSHLNNWRAAVFKCKCDCGKIHYVAGRFLKDGRSRSCGCMKKMMLHQRAKKVLLSPYR